MSIIADISTGMKRYYTIVFSNLLYKRNGYLLVIDIILILRTIKLHTFEFILRKASPDDILRFPHSKMRISPSEWNNPVRIFHI